MTTEKAEYCHCLIAKERVKARVALLNEKSIWVYTWNEKLKKEIVIKRHKERHEVEMI